MQRPAIESASHQPFKTAAINSTDLDAQVDIWASELYSRYYLRLTTVIAAWIACHPTDLDDADDIAQHAICVAVQVLSKHRSPYVGDQSYWCLLKKIALRRFWKRCRRRSLLHQRPWQQVLDRMAETTDLGAETLEEILAVVQTPGDERLLATLKLRLAGWSREEIAAQFGVTARSIDRYLRTVFLRFQKRCQQPVF